MFCPICQKRFNFNSTLVTCEKSQVGPCFEKPLGNSLFGHLVLTVLVARGEALTGRRLQVMSGYTAEGARHNAQPPRRAMHKPWRTVHCGLVRNTQRSGHNAHHTVHSALGTWHEAQRTAHIAQCPTHSSQCTVHIHSQEHCTTQSAPLLVHNGPRVAHHSQRTLHSAHSAQRVTPSHAKATPKPRQASREPGKQAIQPRLPHQWSWTQA